MLKPWHSGALSALRHRNFQHYTWGQIVSLCGSRIHEVAAGWLMWQLTGSAAWVGAIAVAEMIPRLLLWPLAGAIVDKFDRRLLAMVSQSVAAVVALALTISSALGILGVNGLLAFTVAFGMNMALWQPARLAIIPSLVTRDGIASAVGLASVIANLGRVIGPVIAGPVLLWGSVTLAFALNAVSYLAVVAAFWLIDLPRQGTRSRLISRISFADLSFGLSSILRNEGIRWLLLFIAIFAICARSIFELLPVFAEAVLDAGPAGLAALTSALGFGSLFSGIIASSSRQNQYGLIRLLIAAGMIGAIMIGMFAIASTLNTAVFFIAIAGFGVTLTSILAQILLQLALTDDIRGRVLSVYGVLFGCAPGIGALAIGWVADRIGIMIPVLVAAAIGLAVTVALGINRRRLADLLEPAPTEPEAPR